MLILILYYIIYPICLAALYYYKHREMFFLVNQNIKLHNLPPFLIAFFPFVWVENLFVRFKLWWKGKLSETAV